MRRVGSPTGAKKKADTLFSKIVRSRGACERCGRDDYESLQCAHIISRRFSRIRCDERNALCLCWGCHHFFTDHPADFRPFVDRILGDGEYDELYRRAHDVRGPKVNWFDVAADLAFRWANIQAQVGELDTR